MCSQGLPNTPPCLQDQQGAVRLALQNVLLALQGTCCTHLSARTLHLCGQPLCEQPARADRPAQPRPLPLPAGTCCGFVAFAWCPAWTELVSHGVCLLPHSSRQPVQVQVRRDTVISSAEVDAIHDCHCRQALVAPTCGSTGKESSAAWPAPSRAASFAVKICSSSTCKACSMALTCTQAGSKVVHLQASG